MKRIALISILLLACMMGFAQGCLDPLLIQEMNRRSNDERIEVIVLMKAQYDRSQLCRRADYFLSRAERRAFVVNELKAFTEASQHDLKSILAEMESHGLVSSVHSLWSANALYFKATKTALLDLSERTDIETISLNIQHQWIPDGETQEPASATREVTPNIIQVHADQVWEMGYTGAGIVVAVVDSGVNYEHIDLADHLWDGGEEFPHHGYDIVNNDDDPMDDKGHGTHCAGTVCGDGTAGSLTGIAPEATLMCVKSIRGDGFGGAVNIADRCHGLRWQRRQCLSPDDLSSAQQCARSCQLSPTLPRPRPNGQPGRVELCGCRRCGELQRCSRRLHLARPSHMAGHRVWRLCLQPRHRSHPPRCVRSWSKHQVVGLQQHQRLHQYGRHLTGHTLRRGHRRPDAAKEP